MEERHIAKENTDQENGEAELTERKKRKEERYGERTQQESPEEWKRRGCHHQSPDKYGAPKNQITRVKAST